MSDSKEERPRVFPPCKFRKKVDGLHMCYAIGCATVGDMMCECYGCDGKRCTRVGNQKNGA